MSEPTSPQAAPEFYADAFSFGWSPFGVDLTFGREFDPNAGLQDPRATIAMSPQLAKLLARELLAAVDSYEANVGEIVIPFPPEEGQ